MINRIFTTQQIKIEELLNGSFNFDIEGKWALISIHRNPIKPIIKNDQDIATLKYKGCEKVLSVCFGDYTDRDLDLYSKVYKNAESHINLITIDVAKSIVDFIESLKGCEDIKTLVVQCKAGISRSGAVGLYACRYLGLDEDDYLKNSRVIPNFYVYGMLSKIWDPITGYSQLSSES